VPQGGSETRAASSSTEREFAPSPPGDVTQAPDVGRRTSDVGRDLGNARLLPEPGSPLVLAVSGGADSMALWAWCAEAGRWPLTIFHLDHGLRADSAADADFVRAMATRLGGTVVIERVD